jgi:aspartate carbamoyltransferase catalytic subunit
MRSVISIADLTNDEIEDIFALADSADKLRADKVGAGQIMATLFYEPSTRTRLSFESAMQRLGGSVISCSDMQSSSTAKGETVADTAKVVSSYADVLVVRHNWDGAVQAMAEHADVAVINAGDGGHEHPTQTLCDLYTLRKEKGDLKGLTVVVCGDLKNGRTIHSLVYALARFGANVVTLAANGMELPQYVIERLEREYDYGFAPVPTGDLNSVVTETDALYLTPKQPHQLALYTQVDKVIQSQLSSMATGLRYDAFYMTRKQKERMKDGGTNANYPSIGPEFLQEKRFQDTVVMHPLPRVDELSPELDKDRRGIYFKQAANGVPVRMALLEFLRRCNQGQQSGASKAQRAFRSPEPIGPRCHNANCITVKEPASTERRFRIYFADHIGALILGCDYCDHRFKIDYIGNVKTKRYSAFDNALSEMIRDWWDKNELALFDSIKEAEELGYEPTKSSGQRILMAEDEIENALSAISQQILNDCRDPDRLLIVGVRSVGAQLAQRIANEIEAQRKRRPELGEIEIYGAGDELRRTGPADPDLGPLSLKDREVVLVDDVIYTGRTVKSALSIIFRSGRPQAVRLAVLVDRGHREVPVKPNYVGKNIPSSENDRVRVRLRGDDRETSDRVVIYSVMNPTASAQTTANSSREKATNH